MRLSELRLYRAYHVASAADLLWNEPPRCALFGNWARPGRLFEACGFHVTPPCSITFCSSPADTNPTPFPNVAADIEWCNLVLKLSDQGDAFGPSHQCAACHRTCPDKYSGHLPPGINSSPHAYGLPVDHAPQTQTPLPLANAYASAVSSWCLQNSRSL